MLAAVRHLGFWKFKFFNSLRPILHNHANCDIAICAVFQDDDHRYIVFFWKIQNFNGLSPVGGKCASPCQILSKSVKRLLRYGDLTVFFKMAAVRYLRFWKFQFLTVWTVKWSILHNRAKFREDRSICCCDIAIFAVFQDGGRHHLGFWKILNFNGLSPVGGAICVTVPKFIKIGLTVAEIWRIKAFAKGGRPPSWICRARTGTTQEDYLVVFIVEQNLVGIAAVLSIIWKF